MYRVRCRRNGCCTCHALNRKLVICVRGWRSASVWSSGMCGALKFCSVSKRKGSQGSLFVCLQDACHHFTSMGNERRHLWPVLSHFCLRPSHSLDVEATTRFVQLCPDRNILKQVSNPMEFSDSYDTLCTFSEIYERFDSRVLTFAFDSLWQTSSEHVLSVCKPDWSVCSAEITWKALLALVSEESLLELFSKLKTQNFTLLIPQPGCCCSLENVHTSCFLFRLTASKSIQAFKCSTSFIHFWYCPTMKSHHFFFQNIWPSLGLS